MHKPKNLTNLGIQDLRQKIQKIDQKLVELLVERFDLVEQIGQIKACISMPILDSQREELLLVLVQKTLDSNQLLQAEGKDCQQIQKMVIQTYQEILKISKEGQKACKQPKTN